MNNKEDDLILAHLSDLAKSCERKRLPAFSDFLDPVRSENFCGRIGRAFRIRAEAWGGYAGAERKMIGFFPDVSENAAGFPIDTLLISFNKKFNSPPAHRDYLGSILGLGIEREKTGDIRLSGAADNSGALVYAHADISGYIIANLERVGNIPVKVSALDGRTRDLFEDAETAGETRVTVASLRLDAVVAAGFRLSRGKAAALIESEKVLVNWMPVQNGAKNIQNGDTVTVRGMGRIKLEEVAGKTKKDRIILKCILT